MSKEEDAKRHEGWKQVKADWRDVVLVCRKCAKKLDGGFGPDGDETLAKALRRSIDGGGGHKVKARRRQVAVIEVGCLDICPKKAVVMVNCANPASIVLIPKGAEMADVVERLGLRTGDVPGQGSGDAAEQAGAP